MIFCPLGLERNDYYEARSYCDSGAVRAGPYCGGYASVRQERRLSGAIAGGVDTFLSKNKAKTWDSKLAKMTKWVAIVFVLLTLALSLI